MSKKSSSEDRTLRKYYVLFAAVLLGGVLFVWGQVDPILCDVPFVSFFTCPGDSESSDDGRSVAPELPDEEAEDMVDQGTPPTPVPTEYVPTTSVEYEDVEKAIRGDPVLEQFVQNLKAAIESADFETLEGMISEPFNVGPYGSHYDFLNKQEAIARLQAELEGLTITVDLSNEGRRVARDEYATPREANYALLSYGWPKDSVSIIGIKRSGEGYLWADLLLFVALRTK